MQGDRGTGTARGVFAAEVAANLQLCGEHYRLDVVVDGFPPSQPGQFVQVQCRPPRPQASAAEADWPEDRPPRLTQPELAGVEPLLRRPLSLAGRATTADGRVRLTVIHRVVGVGTRWLAGLAEGEPVSILGPLGNGFSIRQGATHAALVGGGVGIPPLIYLAGELAAAGKGTVAFTGARRSELLPLTMVPGARVEASGRPTPCVAEFATCGIDTVIATDDGSAGFRGFISDAFAQWLANTKLPGEDLVVYCCGPEEMMRAVAETSIAAGVECQLALERHMACGMGTCQSCVVKTASDAPGGWKFSLCCTDGPVFDGRQVLW